MSRSRSPEPFHREEGSGARNLNEKICLIVNPRAGAGRAGTQLDALSRAAERAFGQWELRKTESAGHASALATEAAAEGFDLVAAVGGDGTCNEVINGLMAGARSSRVAFAVIPFGTGSDLIKTLKVPRTVAEALWVAATGITLPTDVGLAEVSGPEGRYERYFLNVAGFGANGDVVLRANAMDKRWGGTATFLSATLSSVLHYKAPELMVRWQGPEGDGVWEGHCMSGFVANGSYCGGGMWVGRGGTMHDGLLDMTLIPRSSIANQIVTSPRLYTGTIGTAPGVVRISARAIEVTPKQGEDVPIDLDGEMPGTLPARFSVLPRALQIRGGWTHNPLLNA